MATANISQIIEKLKSLSPEWDETVFNYYNSREPANETAELKEILSYFYQLMDTTTACAREENLSKDEVMKPFANLKCQKIISTFVLHQLQLYWACIPLTTLEKDNPYEAERLLDLVWDQYVIRFSGDKLDSLKYPILPEEFEALCSELDNFADECVQTPLSSSAIYSKLTTEAKLSPSLSQHLVNKINCDWTELKLNYIISQLYSLRKAVRSLQHKLNI